MFVCISNFFFFFNANFFTAIFVMSIYLPFMLHFDPFFFAHSCLYYVIYRNEISRLLHIFTLNMLFYCRTNIRHFKNLNKKTISLPISFKSGSFSQSIFLCVVFNIFFDGFVYIFFGVASDCRCT